ncbi:MAG: hypothetical protein ACUVSX_06000 [Aggregatilineales bacterium]
MIGLFALLGPLGVLAMLIVLTLISRRMGRVTRAAPHYIGFIAAAALVAAGLAARALDIARSADPAVVGDGSQAPLLYTALPALGLTLALVTAWRYWSWLLAERS